MKCEACGGTIDNVENAFEYGGRKLCEDCYLDCVAKPRVCDPWAVYTAKSCENLSNVAGLTDSQEQLLSLVREVKEITREEAAEKLGITLADLERDYAVLRHLEKLRGKKEGNAIYLIPW